MDGNGDVDVSRLLNEEGLEGLLSEEEYRRDWAPLRNFPRGKVEGCCFA